jgi:dTDP-4-dehydrorhamnose 3,5-epimerase
MQDCTLEVVKGDLQGPHLVLAPKFDDPRGWFMQVWQDAPLQWQWKQMNVSFSKRGVVRGLHYRVKRPEAKLVYCVSGEIDDACVCLECGEVKTFILRPDGYGLLVPPGWAHGFRAKEDSTVAYLVSEVYDHTDACGINPMDRRLELPWTFSQEVILSDQDKLWPTFDDR